MKVTYRVISNITGNDLTDMERWVLEPDGTLKYKRGDSLYEDEVKAIFTIEDDKD
jgi:hypothetical protein